MALYTIDYYQIGMKIKARRREYGYTQERLAEICNISTGYLGHLENGSRVPSLETLCGIADALHLSLDYLLLDSAVDADHFLMQTGAAVQKMSPEKYHSFCKIVKVLADHVDEL